MRPRTFVLALAVASALAGVAWQRNTLSHLRAENRELRNDSEAAERMSRENREIQRLREANQEIEKLRTENQDLHKLRNEVRQLREQVKGLASARAENERLRASVSRTVAKNVAALTPRPSLTLDTLSFAGYATPEATLQTMFWALKQGDLETFKKCLSDDARKEAGEQTPEEMRDEMLTLFKGFRIAARKVVSVDEIQLGIQLSREGNATPEEVAIPFKLVGGEWRLGGTR